MNYKFDYATQGIHHFLHVWINHYHMHMLFMFLAHDAIVQVQHLSKEITSVNKKNNALLVSNSWHPSYKYMQMSMLSILR